MKPLTREWVEKAEGDFQVAAQIMRRRKHRVFDAACFHAQQAVEKYFKARLCEAGVAFPKTHDLAALLKLLLPVEPLWSAFLPPSATSGGLRGEFPIPGRYRTFGGGSAAS
jgi:hypothetical protein